uniref:CARD domain-containing protein n=1 Tax=Scleropages formosus TaxID=113540 RepID=A0A8C9SJ41_SCLFO
TQLTRGKKNQKGIHRASLIERVTLVETILDKLSPLVHPEACAKVRAAVTRQEKMRLLYDIVFRCGGAEVKSRFFEILKMIHPHLVQELNGLLSC